MRLILVLLGLDGVLSAVAGALFLPSQLGGVPLPVSGLISGLVNTMLVWAASQVSDSVRLAGLPLWTWLATVGAFALGGPGGDIVFGGRGVMAYSVVLLLVLGALPPALLLRRLG